MSENWHVAITGINQEMLAVFGLKSKGLESYCPLGKRIVKHARQQTLRTFPVFSRYIFVKFNPEDPGYSEPIRSTDGILDIICNNWQPVAVSHETIQEIQKREKAGEFDKLPELKKRQPKWFKSFEILKRLLDA